MDSQKLNKIIVVGDSCEDLFFKVDRIPAVGETLDAQGSSKSFGGKGANQAVGVARLGYQVEMLSQLGNDSQGRQLKALFEEYGVQTYNMKLLDSVDTGIGFILQLRSGNNVVISVGGANTAYDKDMTTFDSEWVQAIQSSKILLLQRLIPDYVNLVAAKIAKEAGVTVILDVGGMQSHVLPELIKFVDYISPNETEVARMLGLQLTGDKAELDQELERFIRKYPHVKVVLKLGEKGCSYLWLENDEIKSISKVAYSFSDYPELQLADTAGAGDSYMAGFACKLLDECSIEECMEYGNKCGFLCVSKAGTMNAVPSKEEIEKTFSK
ncbi:pfkb family protein [Stylonychia lemnae]|uniref:Ribokinase n=1 Tax=Stylonychia lemnae TaxID=5949 RepID=A0A078B0V5_STYLE|nr:pfkb family protein [Stylonychia lemnae]|eukprot:CDW88189.1 pfkb family protein [Stylonychia lemnae]